MAQSSGEGSKRKNYIDWDQYFMGIALLSAERSKDPDRQVGACIVNSDKKIVGVGYNSMPWGCDDDKFPWNRKDQEDGIEEKSFYVCHAEFNAIVNKNSSDLKDCTIYVTLFPCNECAKLIIQTGIRKVVYLLDDKAKKPKFKASKRMFAAAGIKSEPYVGNRETISLYFTNGKDGPAEQRASCCKRPKLE